jgi:hypothetical protein
MAINGGEFILNDLTAMVAGLAIVSAMLSFSLGAISQKSIITAALAVVVIAGCVFTSVGYTLGRVGSVADGGAAGAVAHNANIARAEQRVADLNSGVKAEAANGGCRTECKKLIKRLEAAQTALDTLGARQVVDPAGERIEAVTGGWLSADRYRTAHPVITAATLELGVSLLLTIAGMFASSGKRHVPNVIEAEMIDITPADSVTKLLQQHPQALTNAEIAEALGISAPAASQRVKKLVAAGVVQRDRVGRQVAIRLA